MDRDIPLVTRIEEEDRLSCVVDDTIFQTPPGYTQLGTGNVRCCCFILFYTYYFFLII